MKIKQSWLDKWETDKDAADEIRMIENEISKAIKEYDECELRLKSIRYRINLLNEKMNSLKE